MGNNDSSDGFLKLFDSLRFRNRNRQAGRVELYIKRLEMRRPTLTVLEGAATVIQVWFKRCERPVSLARPSLDDSHYEFLLHNDFFCWS